MKDQIKVTAADLKALDHSNILMFKGISGQFTSAAVAVRAPALIEVVEASNGKQYTLKRDGSEWVLIER